MLDKFTYRRSKLSIFLISFCSIGLLLILIGIMRYISYLKEVDNALLLFEEQVVNTIDTVRYVDVKLIEAMPMTKGYEVIVMDNDGNILVETNAEHRCRTTDDINLQLCKKVYGEAHFDYIDKELKRCRVISLDDLYIGVYYDAIDIHRKVFATILISFFYLLIVDFVITILMGVNNTKIDKSYDEKKKHLDVLISMSKVYNSMHLINLEENTVTEYESNASIRMATEGLVTPKDQIVAAMSELIVDEDQERIMEFIDLDQVVEKLKKRKMISDDFLGVNQGYIRASFINIASKEDSTPYLIMFTTLVIDAEKRKQLQLINKSNTDELTKFFNRRAYDEKIEELMKNPVEDDITIISMDVNGLKVVNDNLGHQAGDELLTGACSCMTLAFGSYASLYRLGGDEFIALICSKSPDLDMLVEKFNSILKSWHGNLVSEISVSTGYASTKEYPGMDLHELEKIADKRMYMDKNNYYRTKGIDHRNRQ